MNAQIPAPTNVSVDRKHTTLTRTAHTTAKGKTRRAPPVSSGPAAVSQLSPQQCADNRSEKHCTPSVPPHTQCASAAYLAHNSPATGNRFHPLHSQIFQALLTLFSKFFSPFPHGTCFLSVSNAGLALDEIYHPLSAPIPRNVTRRECAVRSVHQMPDETVTPRGSLFQESYIGKGHGAFRAQHNSKPGVSICTLSCSLFNRHY